MSPFERKRRRWWLMVWPDDNARSVHNRDPKRKARDIMKVVEVVPAYELRGAVAALESIVSYAYGASGATGDDAGHLTAVGMMAKEALAALRGQ